VDPLPGPGKANSPAVRLQDVATGRLERTDEESHGVYSLAFAPDGRGLALGSKDGRV
jgi:hypothetical protein